MNYIKYLLNIPTQKIKYGLSRTYQLLDACGNPEKEIQTIQIVGTNGKGSVSAFLTHILVQSKYKIGWYTSPHLVCINERIKINFTSIPNSSITEFLKLHLKDIDTIKPSFFEIMTVMAIWYFKKKKVDYAILETGLGGRLDSVTACENDCLVFTPISRDHCEILGNSIDKIANEKAGAIIRKEQQCISTKHNNKITNILNHQATKYNIKINYLNMESNAKIDIEHLPGKHQKENALLAKHVIDILNNFQIIKVTENNIKKGIKKTVWPGRFHTISQNPRIIFDVCHNDQGIQAFKNTVINYYSNKQKKYLICGFEYNKKIHFALKSISILFEEIICTEAGIRKSMPSETIKKNLNINNAISINSINEALNYILKKTKKDDVLFIIGSHFFAPALSNRYNNCFAIDK